MNAHKIYHGQEISALIVIRVEFIITIQKLVPARVNLIGMAIVVKFKDVCMANNGTSFNFNANVQIQLFGMELIAYKKLSALVGNMLINRINAHVLKVDI